MNNKSQSQKSFIFLHQSPPIRNSITQFTNEQTPTKIQKKKFSFCEEHRFRNVHLIFSIGVVSVHGSKEMVALEQWLDIITVPGGKGHSQSMQRVELAPNRFVEEAENENWRFQ